MYLDHFDQVINQKKNIDKNFDLYGLKILIYYLSDNCLPV